MLSELYVAFVVWGTYLTRITASELTGGTSSSWAKMKEFA